MVKHPEIEVQLSGEDGNVFMIIGRVIRAMRRAGLSTDEVQAFAEEAKSSDYDNILNTAERWVMVL